MHAALRNRLSPLFKMTACCPYDKGWRLKMFILVIAMVSLLALLTPILLDAFSSSEPSEALKKEQVVLDISLYERLQEAFTNSPFAVAITMVGLTSAVLLSAGILVIGTYKSTKDKE
jgi:hypothetical protein